MESGIPFPLSEIDTSAPVHSAISAALFWSETRGVPSSTLRIDIEIFPVLPIASLALIARFRITCLNPVSSIKAGNASFPKLVFILALLGIMISRRSIWSFNKSRKS